MLKFVDANMKPIMSNVHDALDRTKLVVEKRSKAKYRTNYKKLWKVIDHRWNDQLHQDKHDTCTSFFCFLDFV